MKPSSALLAALALLALSPAAFANSRVTKPITGPVNAHLGMHLVCKDEVHNHRQTKVCVWVKNA